MIATTKELKEKRDKINEKLEAGDYTKAWTKRKKDELDELNKEIKEKEDADFSETDENESGSVQTFKNEESESMEVTDTEKDVSDDDEEPESAPVKEKKEEGVISETPKKEKTHKYKFIYHTPGDKKIKLQFRRRRYEIVRYGDIVTLTEKEYQSHRDWLRKIN